MTSRHRDTVCVCFVYVWVCVCECDLLQSRWEGDLNSCITSFCQKAFILAPSHPALQTNMRAHAKRVWSGLVCLLLLASVSSLLGGVCPVYPTAILTIRSGFLIFFNPTKRGEREKNTFRRRCRLWCPHPSPLKLGNKTPSDMHVGWSIFRPTNLPPLCLLIDWPQ